MQVNLSPFKHLVNFLIPVRCTKCGVILENGNGLCATCWTTIPFITKPYCACCGLPFEFDIEDGARCAACLRTPPPYQTARSVFVYTAQSRDLILRFKHMDSIHTAPLFASWMVNALENVQDPLCIPVPLHWTRLFMRTYNQAGLLARSIAKDKGWSYDPSLLVRKRRTSSQGHLSPKERARNIRGAFRVPENKKKAVLNKTILLVDDVFTTGATLSACSTALLKAGAKEVHALTLGRVVRGL